MTTRWQRAVAGLKDDGRVRAIGISINRWQPANVLRALETGLIDAVQVVYNVFDQNPEDELFPACREKNIAVIARVPFDEGQPDGNADRRTRAGPTGTFVTSTSSRRTWRRRWNASNGCGRWCPPDMTMPELRAAPHPACIRPSVL